MIDPKTLAGQIKGLTQDSRKVQAGFLFAAFPGNNADGRDYIKSAIDSGATYILAPNGSEKIEGAEYVFHENPRLYFAQLASAFYGEQPSNIAAVTGTNGKTSVVSFLEQLWKAGGNKSTSLGTLGGKMTTLETLALHEELTKCAKSGITHLAMEASSHGLDQCRMHGANVKVAGFTNLSRDHLDYHGDMEAYFAAKLKLFKEVLDPCGTAVLNADIPEFETLRAACTARGVKVIDYGHNAHDIRLIARSLSSVGQTLAIGINDHPYTITLPLVGEFQAMNALCALGMAMALNSKKTEIYLETLEYIKGAAGRLQAIKGHPRGAGIYVDYAHTPDALENVLTALRPHTRGQLVCVMGCGGDRDHGKRPQMGDIATKNADVTIVTDDNPRSEDPSVIRSEILAAAPGAIEIADRAKAIESAILGLEDGDLLVIAGKGHEQGQIVGNQTLPFDDVEVANKAIQSLKK